MGDKGGGKRGAPSPKGQGDNKAVCRWFLKDEGCNRGQACKFVHDWSQVVKAEKCLVCGSKHHKVKDCPRRQQEGGQDGQAAGGLNKKEARLAQAKAKPGPLSPPSPPPMPKASSLTTTTTAPTPPGGATLEEVLCETTKALKVLTAQGGGTPVAIAPAPQAVAAPQENPLQTIQKHLDAIRKLNKGPRLSSRRQRSEQLCWTLELLTPIARQTAKRSETRQ